MIQQVLGELLEEIWQVRDCGSITLAAEDILPPLLPGADTASLLAAADLYVARFGFAGHGAAWRMVDQPLAARILGLILQRDLAHGVSLLRPEAAQVATETFLGLFATPTLFLTNSRFIGEAEPDVLLSQSSWTPITDATFDTGIVAVNADRIGIFWVEDED